MKRLYLVFMLCIFAFSQDDTSISGHFKLLGNDSLLLKHLVSITVTPANQSASIGANITYTATGNYSPSGTKVLTSLASWKSSNLSVATMATNVATCVGAGTTTISAKYGTITGSTSLQCNQTSFAGNDLYCKLGNVPTWGVSDGPATLPQTCFYTDPSIVIATGTVRTINTDADWNTVWGATHCGDIVNITAGAVLTAKHTVPLEACDPSHWVVFGTSGFASLPPYGTKVSPCYAGVASLPGRPNFNCTGVANVMAKMVQPGATEVLTFTAGTKYMYIRGLEITRASGSGNINELINIQAGNIDHIIFEHDWIHGTATDELNKGIVINRTSYIAFVDSFFSDIFCLSVGGACTDAHTIGGGTNKVATDQDNTWKIVNNYLEASGENIIFGGGGAAIVPSDMEIRHNYMFKPMTWNPADPSFDGTIRIVKNSFEVKNGSRILLEGNVFQNLWAGFTQAGRMVFFHGINQSGNCPICIATNITTRYNYLTTGAFAFGSSPEGSNLTVNNFTNNITFHDNIADNMGYANCYHCSNGPMVMSFTNLNNAPPVLHDVYYRHNTLVPFSGQTIQNGNIGITGPPAGPLQMSGYTWSDNLFQYFNPGTPDPLGDCPGACNCASPKHPNVTFNACFSSFSSNGNAIVNNSNTWAGINCTAEASLSSILVNYNNGVMLPGGDFHVKPTSACHNTATDGTDPGANVDRVISTISGYSF